MSRFVQSLVNNFVGSLFLECVISYSFITDYVLYIFFHCSYTYFYIIQEEADSPPLLTDNTRGNGHSIHARNDPHSNHHQPGRVIRGDHMDRRGRADSRDSGRRSRPQDLIIDKMGSNDLTIAIFIMVGMAERIRASAVEKAAATLIVVKTADTFVISSRLMDMTSTTTIIIITIMTSRLVDIGVVAEIDW
jgi:hypothetical protein